MRVRLRTTTAEDLDFVLAAECDEENSPFIGQWTREQHAAGLQDADIAHMVVESVEDGQRVGYVILTGLADRSQGIRLRRICVTEKGKGYGGEVVRLVKQLAFQELQVERLWLTVRGHNVRAQRLYESAGFLREEPRQRCTQVSAGVKPGIVMSMLRGEDDG
jgi:RimJ/RimL family protein N-acetyltransferase